MVGQLLILGSLFYLLTRERSESTPPTTDTPEAPQEPPKPLPVEGDDYRVELVATGEQNEIQLLESRRGVLYDDGSGSQTWEPSGYIRGNLTDGFVRASASVGGTMTFTIKGRTYEDTLIYKTIQDAQTADEIPEDDPSGPQKQPEPEDDDTDNGGGLNIPPGFGGGLGGGNYWTGPIGGGI